MLLSATQPPLVKRRWRAPLWLPWLAAPAFMLLPIGGCGVAEQFLRGEQRAMTRNHAPAAVPDLVQVSSTATATRPIALPAMRLAGGEKSPQAGDDPMGRFAARLHEERSEPILGHDDFDGVILQVGAAEQGVDFGGPVRVGGLGHGGHDKVVASEGLELGVVDERMHRVFGDRVAGP